MLTLMRRFEDSPGPNRWVRCSVRLGLVLTGLVVFTGLPVTAHADSRYAEDDGMVLAFQLGLGSGEFSVDEGSTGQETGVAGNMRFGFRMSPAFMLSLDIGGWSGNIDDTKLGQLNIVGALTWWIRGGDGVYLRAGGGFGAGRAEIPFTSGGSSGIEESGGALLIAAGYEFRTAPRFGFGPDLQYSVQELSGGVSGSAVSLTFGFNWYL